MRSPRRFSRQLAPSALFALSVIVAASPVAAQQTAYVSGTPDDVCADPAQTGCTRGVISVVSTGTGQVQGAIDVWRQGIGSFQALLVDPAGAKLYAVLDSGGGSHPLLAATTVFRVFDTRTLSQAGSFSVDGVVSACTFAADGARLFCARNVLASDVVVIDTATRAVASTIPATFPRALALSRAGDRLYVSHQDNRITVHDSATYAQLATIPLPATGVALEISPDGAHLYAGLSDRSVADVDTSTDTVAGFVPNVATGSSVPQDIAFAKGRAYVTTSGGGASDGVTVIDVASRTITGRIAVSSPLEDAASLDESRVFVTRAQGLTAIDTATGQPTTVAALPDGPGRLALSPPPPGTSLVIDVPAQGARVAQPFTFGGWAVDVLGSTAGPGIDAVHVWAFPAGGGNPMFAGAAEYGRPRPDVAAIFGSAYLNSGYQMSVRGLSPGTYTLTAYGHSTRTGTFSIARQVAVTVTSSVQMAVDAPASGASVPGTFVVAGWALDGGQASGSGVDAVHVWAYPASGAAPVFAGAASLGGSRPDVAAAFGSQFGSAGYALNVTNLPPGTYTLRVYAHQASTGTFAAERAVSVTVTSPQPYIVIDVPGADAVTGTSVRVAGWAIENGAASGTGVDAVHVWAYPAAGGAPRLVGVAAYGASRPDVGAIFGSRYTPSGFDVTGSLPAGSYTIVAFAHSTTTDSFRGVRTVSITVR